MTQLIARIKFEEIYTRRAIESRKYCVVYYILHINEQSSKYNVFVINSWVTLSAAAAASSTSVVKCQCCRSQAERGESKNRQGGRRWEVVPSVGRRSREVFPIDQNNNNNNNNDPLYRAYARARYSKYIMFFYLFSLSLCCCSATKLNKQKGERTPICWGLGICTAEIVDAILTNTKVILPVSTYIRVSVVVFAFFYTCAHFFSQCLLGILHGTHINVHAIKNSSTTAYIQYTTRIKLLHCSKHIYTTYTLYLKSTAARNSLTAGAHLENVLPAT